MASRREEELFELENVEVKVETPKALLCIAQDAKGRDVEVWIPKGQLRDGNEVNARGDTGTLVCTEWIAHEKGLL
jgi:hypothetical protein